MCSFYHEPLCTSIETNVNKFAISNHTALQFKAEVLRSHLRLVCEYELYTLPNKKVSAAKDHGKNYMKDRPPLIRHLLRDRLLQNNKKQTTNVDALCQIAILRNYSALRRCPFSVLPLPGILLLPFYQEYRFKLEYIIKVSLAFNSILTRVS